MSNSELFPSGSVYSVILPDSVEVGQIASQPNDQSFDLAVVEYEDSGDFVHSSQLDNAIKCIENARINNPNGAIVVLFIHGWHHNAEWDIEKGEGDSHFKAFREVLKSLTYREAERYGDNDGIGRRVVGIYFGWNGDPHYSFLRDTQILTHFSFWNRYKTAKEIGEHIDTTVAIQKIVTATKKPIESSSDFPGRYRSESPLILAGHSMGALILETTFLELLKKEDQPLVGEKSESDDSCIKTRKDGKLVTFPDLVLSLNSATNSKITKQILEILEEQNMSKRAETEEISYAPPLFISLASTDDWDTKLIWRLAQFPRIWHKTDGHDKSLFTHKFFKTQDLADCPGIATQVDFGQGWACLRKPQPSHKPTPEIDIDLPVQEREDYESTLEHSRYRLSPLADYDSPELSWIFQVPPEIISDHNDIFNSKSSLLILGLIQISGAVMSLAEEWTQNFE